MIASIHSVLRKRMALDSSAGTSALLLTQSSCAGEQQEPGATGKVLKGCWYQSNYTALPWSRNTWTAAGIIDPHTDTCQSKH